jgi:hypothetical protein
MNHRHPLPTRLVEQANALVEFANGGAQCHVRLRDGRLLPGVLVSNSTAIVAMRGFKDLPFRVEDIQALEQLDDDAAPSTRADWHFFDNWASTAGGNGGG